METKISLFITAQLWENSFAETHSRWFCRQQLMWFSNKSFHSLSGRRNPTPFHYKFSFLLFWGSLMIIRFHNTEKHLQRNALTEMNGNGLIEFLDPKSFLLLNERTKKKNQPFLMESKISGLKVLSLSDNCCLFITILTQSTLNWHFFVMVFMSELCFHQQATPHNKNYCK